MSFIILMLKAERLAHVESSDSSKVWSVCMQKHNRWKMMIIPETMLNIKTKVQYRTQHEVCVLHTGCDPCWVSAAVSVRQIAISPSMRRIALWQYPSHIEPRSLGQLQYLISQCKKITRLLSYTLCWGCGGGGGLGASSQTLQQTLHHQVLSTPSLRALILADFQMHT